MPSHMSLISSKFLKLSISAQFIRSTSLYPPVVPRFPPGIWGQLPDWEAWNLHRFKIRLNRKPTLEKKLKYYGWSEKRCFWILDANYRQGRVLNVLKYLTRTEIYNHLPEKIRRNEQNKHELRQLINSINSEFEFLMKFYNVENVLNLPDSIDVPALIFRRAYEHIVAQQLSNMKENEDFDDFLQFDDSTHIRAFFPRPVPHNCSGRSKSGLCNFYIDEICHRNIRSSYEIEPFFSANDNLCQNVNFSNLDFPPGRYGVCRKSIIPEILPGFRLGDPFTSPLLALYRTDLEPSYHALLMNFGQAVATAHFRNFFPFHEMDIPRPIVTQCVVARKDSFVFAGHQLNSLCNLYVDEPGKFGQNLMWVSDPYSLLSPNDVECNPDVVQVLLQMLTVPRVKWEEQKKVEMDPGRSIKEDYYDRIYDYMNT